MKQIINFMIGNKLAVWILTILLVVWGIFASTSIKYESIPNISLPTLSISAVYPNATPEQVADDVSKPLENAISSIDGVDSVSSSSSQNMASITVNYNYDTDLDDAQAALEKALKSVTLPDGVEEPSVMQFSSSSMPILAVSVSTDDGDLKTASTYVEDSIQPALEKIDGVGQLTVTGQAAYEIELTFNEKKLTALGTTESAVTQAIQNQNVTTQLGLYTLDNTKKSIVVNDKATSLNELKNMELVLGTSTAQLPNDTQQAPTTEATSTQQTIKLKDVATLKKVENHDSISRVNGKDAISIQVTAAQDANTVDVVNAAKEKFEELEKANDALHIDITSDQGQPIEDSVNTMLEKAIYGAIFAVLVILVFLRNFRSTIISIVSIPLSLLTSIAIIKSLDMSLNMMTLGALTVAIGRVIDDSIVVVENIYRRMHDKEEKLRGRQLIASATAEMFKPILSSTLVTVAVFTPIIFIDGLVAELFGPFALTMAIALGMSLIVAITLVPIMAHTMFKKEILATPDTKKDNKPKHSRIAIRYGKMLNAALNHKFITLAVALVILIGSIALLPKVGFSFLGSEQQTTMITTYTPATGELDKNVDASIKEAEKYIAKQDGVTLVQSSITSNTSASSMGSSGSMLYIIFDEDTEDLAAKQQKLFEHLKTFHHKGTWKQQDFSTMGTSNEVSYTISSTDRKKVEKAALQIEDVLNNETDLKDAKSSVSDSYPQYTFNLKQKALKEYGLTASQLSPMLMQATGDTIVTTLVDNDDELNVIVKQDDSKTLKTMKAFLKQNITTQNGEVALSELVSIEKSTTPSSISRQDNKEYATVTAAVKGDEVSAVSARIGKEINDLDFDKGVTLEQGGTSADIQESFTQLGLAIIAAIFLVYFILVVTFREGLAPFAILFSLPFTLIGAILGLLIAGESFSVSSMLGILMLVGIVVTNAIVLVDRVIHNERAGRSMRESLIDAAETRLRPILMTAIATVFALLPLALSSSSGSSIISQGLGITVVGGLITSTVLTLFIVPVVYEGLSKLFKKNRHKTID